jgi:hypothetical protein
VMAWAEGSEWARHDDAMPAAAKADEDERRNKPHMARNVLMYGMRQPCAVADCHSPAVVKGLCVKHQLLSAREPITTLERRLGRPMTEEEERMRLHEARDLGMV